MSDGVYWVNDFVYVDSANGLETNNGMLLSCPVKTIAQAVTNANALSLNKIKAIGAYSVATEETINASGITISSFASVDKTVVSVASGNSLTLSNGTIEGKVEVLSSGNLIMLVEQSLI